VKPKNNKLGQLDKKLVSIRKLEPLTDGVLQHLPTMAPWFVRCLKMLSALDNHADLHRVVTVPTGRGMWAIALVFDGYYAIKGMAEDVAEYWAGVMQLPCGMPHGEGAGSATRRRRSRRK
jgi:hypothetical protein